jgi:hypothetical protein
LLTRYAVKEVFMKSRWILIMLALVLAVPAAAAGKKFGKQVRYAGVHPIPKHEGGGICYLEGRHVHIYAANKIEYRTHGDDYVFVGDPVAYGWDGPKYTYKGQHPIHVDAMVGGDPDVEYCYLEGPHYHYSEPPESPDYKVVGGAHFYVGEPPRAFIDARPTYVGINAVYRPLVYTRPVVEVDAPVGWIGARAEFIGPGVVVGGRGAVVAPAPGVRVDARVHIPMPSVRVGVEIGGPAVIVRERPGVIVVPHGKYKHKKYKHRKYRGR